jgi:Tol biopolymer transport system component
MRRLLPAFGLALALLTLLPPLAGALPGRLLIPDGHGGIELFDAKNGDQRRVAKRAARPAFASDGKAFAYIREGGCFRIPKGCYTEYSIFLKSLADHRAQTPGRQVFGWKQFFVRAVDVAPGGRLIFSAEPGPGPGRRGRGLEIYSAAPDGSRIRQLTHNRVFDNDPAVSPDGRFVAFSRRVHGRGQIFTMRIDGRGVLRVTRDDSRDRSPAWSPGGRRILYVSQSAAESHRRREIYAIRADGQNRQQLTFNQVVESEPTYSPDGRWIAYVQAGELWAMRPGGTDPRRVLAPRKSSGFEGGIDWAF